MNKKCTDYNIVLIFLLGHCIEWLLESCRGLYGEIKVKKIENFIWCFVEFVIHVPSLCTFVCVCVYVLHLLQCGSVEFLWYLLVSLFL